MKISYPPSPAALPLNTKFPLSSSTTDSKYISDWLFCEGIQLVFDQTSFKLESYFLAEKYSYTPLTIRPYKVYKVFIWIYRKLEEKIFKYSLKLYSIKPKL